MKTVKIFSIIFSTLFTVYLNASKSKIESIPFISSGPTLISHNKYAKESQMARAKLLTENVLYILFWFEKLKD